AELNSAKSAGTEKSSRINSLTGQAKLDGETEFAQDLCSKIRQTRRSEVAGTRGRPRRRAHFEPLSGPPSRTPRGPPECAWSGRFGLWQHFFGSNLPVRASGSRRISERVRRRPRRERTTLWASANDISSLRGPLCPRQSLSSNGFLGAIQLQVRKHFGSWCRL